MGTDSIAAAPIGLIYIMASDTTAKSSVFSLRGLLVMVLVVVGVLLWAAVLTPLVKGPAVSTEPTSLDAARVANIPGTPTAGVKQIYTRPGPASHTEISTGASGKAAASKKKTKPSETVESLEKSEKKARKAVAKLKASGMVMEKAPEAKKAIAKLQLVTRKLIMARYAPYARKTAAGTVFHLKMALEFPRMMPDTHSTTSKSGRKAEMVIETAPISLMPHAVFLFLEMALHWHGGAFHRNAGHVVQAAPEGGHLGLAFQEYSPKFPHVSGTLGYAGRPGGPSFYISTVDNTRNHGPASQGSKSEADSCFARVLEGQDTFKRLGHVWGTQENNFTPDDMGFLGSSDQHAKITLSLIPLKQDKFED